MIFVFGGKLREKKKFSIDVERLYQQEKYFDDNPHDFCLPSWNWKCSIE